MGDEEIKEYPTNYKDIVEKYEESQRRAEESYKKRSGNVNLESAIALGALQDRDSRLAKPVESLSNRRVIKQPTDPAVLAEEKRIFQQIFGKTPPDQAEGG